MKGQTSTMKIRLFPWQSKSLQTPVHPPFPLSLDFRWPILYRVVTLETAPYVFIERNWVDEGKERERETRHGLWYRFPFSLENAEGLKLFNWIEDSLWSHHLSRCSRCLLLFILKLQDVVWCGNISLVIELELGAIIIFLQCYGSKSPLPGAVRGTIASRLDLWRHTCFTAH